MTDLNCRKTRDLLGENRHIASWESIHARSPKCEGCGGDLMPTPWEWPKQQWTSPQPHHRGRTLVRAPTDMSIYISENLCPVSKNTTHGVAWEKWNRKTFENGPWPCIHCHQPVIPDRSRNTFRALHYLIEEDPW